MPSNIQIILVTGAIVFFLVILYLFFRPLFTRKLIQNSLDDSQSMLFTEELEQGTLEFDDDNDSTQEQELIILNLVSMDKSNFNMNQVLTLLKNLDAKYVNGFFSYRDLNGREVYRIASGLNPGLLEADTETHVLLMALDLNQDGRNRGVSNADVFYYIKNNLPFSELIWEFGTEDNPNWVHVAIAKGRENEKKIKIAEKINGKTQYKVWDRD